MTVAGLAAGGVMPVLTATQRAQPLRVSVAVADRSALGFLPLTLAEQLGFFKAEGLAVDITEHPDEGRAIAAATSGTAQVVSGAYPEIISLQARAHTFQAFVMQSRAPQLALGISTRHPPDARWALQLRGLRVGVVSLGSSSHLVASRALASAGMANGDMRFVDVGSSAGALAALRAGQVDALCGVDPLMTLLEQKGEVRIVSDTRTLKGCQEVFDGPMPGTCLCASRDFLKKNTEAAQALSHGIVRALKWLRTAGPADLVKTVPESHLLGDRALYLASFTKVREAISLDGVLPDEGARTALRALAAFDGSIKARQIDLSQTYTNDFARRSKRRFEA